MQFLPVSDPRSFSLPIMAASSIVIGILVLMSSNWIKGETSMVTVPKHITAKIVHVDRPKAKTVKKPVKAKKPVVKKPTPKPKVIDKPKQVPVKKPQEKTPPKPIKKAPLPLPGADITQALEEEQALMELNELLNEEIYARQSEKNQEAIASHAGQIKALIQSVWRFPPSAQHDQIVLLRIFMVPTGEVTEVQVVEASGNEALDRSAEQAVWKVGKFPVPKDPVLFEDQFRKFLIKLKPENARL